VSAPLRSASQCAGSAWTTHAPGACCSLCGESACIVLNVASHTHQDAYVGDYETSRALITVNLSAAAGVVTIKNPPFDATMSVASFVTKGKDGAVNLNYLKLTGEVEFDDTGKKCTTITWSNGTVWGKLGLDPTPVEDGPVHAEYEKAPPLSADEKALMKASAMGDVAELEKLIKKGTNFKGIRDKVRVCMCHGACVWR
jgi:hypothetical protein